MIQMIDKIFLDVDGVLANWNQAVRDKYKIQYPDPENFNGVHKLVNQTWGDFWDAILTDYNFWKTIPVRPNANKIVGLVEDYGVPVCLLTSVPSGHAMAGRADWIKEHLPKFWKSKHYLFGSCKALCASPTALLIDDADHNIADFSSAGGHVITFPQAWNKEHGKDSLIHLTEELTKLKEEGLL